MKTHVWKLSNSDGTDISEDSEYNIEFGGVIYTLWICMGCRATIGWPGHPDDVALQTTVFEFGSIKLDCDEEVIRRVLET